MCADLVNQVNAATVLYSPCGQCTEQMYIFLILVQLEIVVFSELNLFSYRITRYRRIL